MACLDGRFSWFNPLAMFYTELNVPAWMLVGLAVSVVAATGGALALQARDRRAPLAAAAVGALIVLAGVAATWLAPRGSSARSWLELVVPSLVTWTLPALASAVAVAVLARRGRWERFAAGLALGAVAAFFAVAAGLVAACGLTGDCL